MIRPPSCSRRRVTTRAWSGSSQTPHACTQSIWCMHAARAVGAVNAKGEVSKGDPNGAAGATHACAEVVGAMRAGADNAYGSVGARCSGVLAALLGGHLATVFEGL